MGTGEINAGGNPAMDWHPIQGGVEYSLSLHATETGISSGLMGRLARMQTLPFYLQKVLLCKVKSLPNFLLHSFHVTYRVAAKNYGCCALSMHRVSRSVLVSGKVKQLL